MKTFFVLYVLIVSNTGVDIAKAMKTITMHPTLNECEAPSATQAIPCIKPWTERMV